MSKNEKIICKKCNEKELIGIAHKYCPDCQKKANKQKKIFIIAACTLVIASIVYVVIPVDLIPDFIPGAGQVDDISVAGVGGIGAIASTIIAIVNGMIANDK